MRSIFVKGGLRLAQTRMLIGWLTSVTGFVLVCECVKATWSVQCLGTVGIQSCANAKSDAVKVESPGPSALR